VSLGSGATDVSDFSTLGADKIGTLAAWTRTAAILSIPPSTYRPTSSKLLAPYFRTWPKCDVARDEIEVRFKLGSGRLCCGPGNARYGFTA
jgi:hypothetical protein